MLRGKPEPAELEEEVPPLGVLLRPAIEATARDDGWAHLGAVGAMISKQHPSFDSRNYGQKKLSLLAREQPYVEVKEAQSTDDRPGVVYVRLRSGARG